jgi:polar amino acid transport system substrate-binding protein
MKLLLCFVFLFLSGLTAFFTQIHFPNDPEHSLDKISNGTIRVGFTHAEPWVFPSDSGARGIEAFLIAAFAKTVNAKIDWTEGTEEQLYNALKHHEIDILLAGITDETPWKNEIGLTQPYLETETVIGQPVSQPLTGSSIKDQWVAVRKGTDLGYYIRKKKAKPFYTDRLPVSNMPSTGYDWQLINWKLKSTGIVLKKEKHVMAVPPGENGFLLALDKFLFINKSLIKEQLMHP